MGKFNYKEIAEFCTAGGTVAQAVEKYDCSIATVNAACVAFGISKVALRYRKIADYVRETSCTVKEASAVLGFTTTTIQRACIKHRVIPKASLATQTHPSTLKIIGRMLNGGELTDVEIGNEFGVTKQRINQIRKAAKEAGIL